MGERRAIYVGNLDSGVDDETLKALFGQCGEVVKVRLAGDGSKPTRFAFVEFSDPKMTDTALLLDGLEIFNRNLKVNLAKGNGVRGGTDTSGAPPAQHQPPASHKPQAPFQSNAGLPAPPVGAGAPPQPSYHARPPPPAAPYPHLPPPPHPAPPPHPPAPRHGVYAPSPIPSPMPNDPDRVHRTIHCAGIGEALQSGGMNEEMLAEYFGAAGEVAAVRISGRFAWIEFATNAGGQAALMLDGEPLGEGTLRLSQSKTPIHTAGWRPGVGKLSVGKETGEICRDYQKGSCSRGENCRFRHGQSYDDRGERSERSEAPTTNRYYQQSQDHQGGYKSAGYAGIPPPPDPRRHSNYTTSSQPAEATTYTQYPQSAHPYNYSQQTKPSDPRGYNQRQATDPRDYYRQNPPPPADPRVAGYSQQQPTDPRASRVASRGNGDASRYEHHPYHRQSSR